MKETHLTLTEKKEFIFEKPEPYITIHIANKETYEKLADVIDRDTPAEVEIEEMKSPDYKSYSIICPECKSTVSIGNTEREAMRLLTKYCPYCGQALINEVRL